MFFRAGVQSSLVSLPAMYILSVLLFRTALGGFTAEYHTPVDMGGLYWHFIDLVGSFFTPSSTHRGYI